MRIKSVTLLRILVALATWIAVGDVWADDPLPSWNEGPAKKSIIDFVDRVTKEGGPDYVSPAERIAVFDNDGTLWCEEPIYVQSAFAMDRVKELAPQHPEWKDQPLFKAAIDGDYVAIANAHARGAIGLINATHSGMTTEEFNKIVRKWLGTAKNPRFHRPYTDLIYQPMIEVLEYFRANGFKTYIVSAAGVEFMRQFAMHSYGIPPEQVIGSSIKLKYEMQGDKPVLMRQPEIETITNEAGKAIGIENVIGRRPIAAFGNSDGDLAMLEWTTAGSGARLGMLVHHTDAKREWAYDKDSHVGKLDKGLTEAPQRGWTLIDMKNDWKVIFPFEKE
jgi:phosphoserine phosphatase